MKTEKRGVMFFNFGDKCVARLLTAIYTLREVYKGPITVALAKNDEANVLLSKDLEGFSVDILWFDFVSKVKRNIKSILKPHLFTLSPYETTLMFDGDLIFTKPLDHLFEKTEEFGFLVTHFSEWYSNGATMSRRVRKLSKIFNNKQMDAALEHHPAVNIGVLGYNKEKGGKLLRKWTQVTKDVAGIFIADEIAMQGVYFWYDHYMAEGKYNYSCHFGRDFDKAVVIHYHGNKHTNMERYSSRLWWGAVGCIREKHDIDISKWLAADPQASAVMSHHNFDPEILLKCKKEWVDLVKDNKTIVEEDEVIPEDKSDEA
jgi:hypothetical protein